MDEKKYGIAFDKGFKLTLHFLMSRGVSQDMAEDIAQKAWIHGWKFLHQLRDDHVVVSWVNRIAYNFYLDFLRKRHVIYEPLSDYMHLTKEEVSQDIDIDVRTLLELCSKKDKALLEHDLCGFTSEEIAPMFDITANAVRIRICVAKRRLQKEVKTRAATA